MRDAIKDMQRKMFLNPETEDRLVRIQSMSRETGLTLTQIVLGYLLSQPFPTLPVFSARDADQLRDTLTAAAVRLPPDALAFLASD
jgi:aryl-alcohol dehydrogenase-like predicted oxidoreductase